MKNVIYIFILSVLLIACSDDDSVSSKDKVINQITSSTWVVDDVEHGTDGDLTTQYEDFQIAFTKSKSENFIGDYFVANGGYAFPDAFGKWNLTEDLKSIQFNNDQELSVEFSGDKMILDFTVNPPDGGRIAGLSGHFTFTLSPAP